MTTMTPQQMFSTAYLGVFAQGGGSFLFEGCAAVCRYRVVNGAKCAIGHLISDAAYNKCIEGTGVTGTYYAETATRPDNLGNALRASNIDVNQNTAALMYDMQGAHDNAARAHPIDPVDFLKAFGARMHSVATRFALTVPDLPTAKEPA